MSLEINLEDFPNLLSVFEEIERGELRRSFPSVDPELENLLDRERKQRAFTTLEGKPEGRNTDRELSKQDRRQRTSSAKKKTNGISNDWLLVALETIDQRTIPVLPAVFGVANHSCANGTKGCTFLGLHALPKTVLYNITGTFRRLT